MKSYFNRAGYWFWYVTSLSLPAVFLGWWLYGDWLLPLTLLGQLSIVMAFDLATTEIPPNMRNRYEKDIEI